MADTRLKLLVVDDDDLVVSALRMTLPSGWRLTHAASVSELGKQLSQGPFHAALVDMHLGPRTRKAEGVEVVASLAAADPHLEIVAMSGDLDRDLMEACLKAGATRFLAKPLSPDELILTLDKIEALLLLREASSRATTTDSPNWIGASSSSQEIRRQIASLRAEKGPILIEGESGTGKEVVAHLIHAQEGSGRPFVAVNLAALPENVFESEFFGHVRGAFTGADQNKMGLAEAAHGGDLFLDEAEALPPSQQAKLLRFLESGEIRRVGAKESSRVSVRVIAATNQNLEALAREGKYREDLIWRLSGRKVQLPALRERLEDIPDLVEHFLKSERPRRNKSAGSDAIEALKLHPWPGNVRELKRVCEQLSLHSPLPVIREDDVRILFPTRLTASKTQDVDLSRGLGELLGEYEAHLIELALKNAGDIDKTAQLLKISRSSLYKKMKDYNIEARS